MVKKIFKRTLSIFLTLVLLATTFFIFDPSVLKMDAKAWLDVETNAGVASMTTPAGNAPETVYLKPGANEFQYFSNISSTTGEAAGSKDSTGVVSFKNQSASSVKIYVNNLWHRTSKTGTSDSDYEDFAISNLQLATTAGSKMSITKAGLTASKSTVNSGATEIASGTNSASATLTTDSRLTGTTQGEVYVIEWAVVSVIDGKNHVMFMYTGIYVPSLQLTGVAGQAKHTGSVGNEPKTSGFAFVTGAMNYAAVGNRSHVFTKKLTDFSGNPAVKPYLAPLVGFVGQRNNGTNYTIPNESVGENFSGNSASFLPTTGTKTVLVTDNRHEEWSNWNYWSTYTTWGSYSNPNPAGTTHKDAFSAGATTSVLTGVAYEVVDTSRFASYDQIPNFQVGFIRYFMERGGDYAYLDFIRLQDKADTYDTSATIYGNASVNRSDFDEDGSSARTWGLYTLNAPIQNGGKYIMYHYTQDLTGFNRAIHMNFGIGLYTHAVNKDGLRRAYCQYLNSVIDNVNDSSFSTGYAYIKETGRRLCDPTCTSGSTISGFSESDVKTWNDRVVSANSGALYFHVPETIYIKPNSNAFEYYVNYDQQDAVSALAEAEATEGNVYFNYKNASKVVSLTCTSSSGATLSSISVGKTSSTTGSLTTTITSGSLASHSDATLKWTLVYTDKTSGENREVTAYTYCTVPLAKASGNNSNTVVSVTTEPRYTSLTHDNTCSAGTAWVVGLYSVDSNGSGTDASGSYKRSPLYNPSEGVPSAGEKSVTVYNSGTGGGGYWATDDSVGSSTDVNNFKGGSGTIYIDSSRYTNVGQIPDFYVGVDCNYEMQSRKSTFVSAYTGFSTSTLTLVAGDDSTDRDGGYTSGLKHPSGAITKNTTTSNTLYVRQHVQTNGNTTRHGYGWCYITCNYRNKAKLREAYNYYLENSPVLKQEMFKATEWTKLQNYYTAIIPYLEDPENITAQSTMDTAATNLYNQVAAMLGAITNPTGGDSSSSTFTYRKYDGTNVTGAKRSDYIFSSEALAYHYNMNTGALIANQGANPETIPYFYGDTVLADKNDYVGYKFDHAEVGRLFDGAALVNATATNGLGTASWNASTKTLTFASKSGTDNYNNYPGPGASIDSYYNIPVKPGSTFKLSYTATGTTSQVFAFYAGADRKTLPNSGAWCSSNYSTGNQTISFTVPSNCYYLTFRFGNQTPNSTTTFTNIKYNVVSTTVPDEVDNANESGIFWNMYYKPITTTVEYDPAGGTFNNSTATTTTTVDYDTNYAVCKIGSANPANPTRTGYTFKKWLLDVNNTEYDRGAAFNPWRFAVPTAKFTAEWDAIKYNIAFNSNGGSGSMSTIYDVKYDTSEPLPVNTFVRTGYTFTGWKVENAGSLIAGSTDSVASYVTNLTSTNGATVTLYAQWSAVTYTATAKAYSNTAANATTWSNNTTGGTVAINNGTAGGTATASINYLTDYTLKATPATGYYFVGWYSEAPKGTNESSKVSGNNPFTRNMPAADQTTYARFDIKQYTITMYRNYDGSDTNVVNNLINAKYGESKTITVPTRTGYTFKGWYTAKSNGTQIYGTTSPITIKDHGDNNTPVSLYAQWTAKTINVSYAAGGGSGTGPESTSFAYGSSFTPAANTFTPPAKKTVSFNVNGGSGSVSPLDSTYTFVNWKSSANSTNYSAGTAYNDSLGSTGSAVTLTAQWKQNPITLPAGPTRVGYTFAGWYDSSTGGNRIGGAGSSYTPTSTPTTLYAQWTVNAHDVNVYAYGNSVTGVNTWTSGVGGTVTGKGTYDYGASFTVGATAATGYKFVGWYTAAPTNGTTWGTAVTPATTMGESNLTYYARFDLVYCTVTAKAYSNTFATQTSWANNATGGTVKVVGATTDNADTASASGKVITGNSATLTATAKTGYHFVGWYDSTTVSGTPTSTDASITVAYSASGATKYARFDVNANSLTVNPNGGSVKVGTETISASKTYTQQGGTTLAVYKPTRTGYTFAGWTKSSTFNGSITSTTADATYTFANNTYGKTDTITASWTANKYIIAFNKNDTAATGTMNNMTDCSYDTSYTLTANAFTKTGYTFAGWATTSDGSVAYADKASVKNLTAVDGATVILYAKWTVNNYKLDLNGKLDGTTGGNIAGYGKADVYVNGTLKGNQVTDFYQDVPYGGSYEIKNITATEGHYYVGVASGNLTGTMPANNVGVVLEFATEQYTINFYKNDGTSATHSVLSNVKYGTSQSVTVPTRTGYTFKGWYDAATGGNQFLNATTTSFTVADYGNNNAIKNYYAQWTINQYTIKAHAMTEGTTGTLTESATGGTVKINTTAAGATATVTVDYNTALTYTPSANTGYTFSGWFSDAACTKAATPIANATANAEYYAKFSIAKYTLTVKAYSNTAGSTSYTNNTTGGTVKIDSGAANATATASVNYNGTPKITATAATGYKFDGWYSSVTTNSSGVVTSWGTQYSTSTAPNSEAMTTNRTYYAKFTLKSITVKYDANGGTNGAVTSATAYYGQDLTIGATPTRTGYKLLGWAETSTATTATYTTSVAATTINTWVNAGATKTIYAVWEQYQYDEVFLAASNNANDLGTYKINENGGTIALKSGVTKINTGDKILDKLVITPKTGYEFVEVRYKEIATSFDSKDSNVNVTTWSGAFTTKNTAYQTMPAFNDQSKVEFIAYFSVCQFEATAYAYSNSISGGYTNTAAGGSVKCGQAGAPGATAQETAYYGDTNGVTFYATANTGYTFAGWYSDAGLTKQLTTASSIKVVLGDDRADANVNKRYAKFSINTHNAYARAKYYVDGNDNAAGPGINGINGGTVTVSTSTATATTSDNNAVSIAVKYNDIVTYTATPATGYEFYGWYSSTNTSDDENIEDVEAIDPDSPYMLVMPDSDVRIHAKFLPKVFVVNLNPNGGTNATIAALTVTYNQSYTITSDAKPVRSSYNFIGWAETPTATKPDYDHRNSNCTIDVSIINRWFESLPEGEEVYEIYAIWEIAKYVVTFDDQGGEGGPTSVEVTYNENVPTITSIPTNEGYKFKGYYSEIGGADESTKYYNADGTSAKKWDKASGAVLYAKWVCPVLKDATYDENTGKWTYIYEGEKGTDVSTTPTTETLTKQGITDKAPTGAKEVTSVDKTSVEPVKNRIKETEKINLNHYTAAALDQLLDNVTKTNTDLKRNDLTQVELNEYVAKLARYTDIDAAGNKDTTEKIKPSIKLYETKEKVKLVKNDTLTKDKSIVKENYGKPASDDGSSYVYTDKYSNYKKDAVDYYIYTNSATPVIALEIDDGEVGTSVYSNKASYPTNAIVSAECNSEVVPDKAHSFMHSAVPATNDINGAWFSKYTKANIGVGSYDYNAKEIVYLTPTFTATSTTSTTDEIVYTITPSDDAYNPNTGMTKSEIANIPATQADSFSTYKASKAEAESITVCVCYHNSMNVTGNVVDEGGQVGEDYFQMYIDQVDLENSYQDIWLNQMHLFRQSGGANNWEIVMASESVYPVQDETFKDTGYVLGSFAYVFDATNEPTATSYAESGDMIAAKNAIIKSIKQAPSEKQQAIMTQGHAEHLSDGLGFFEIGGWSTNFYPKKGAYVYAHIVDRWGNYFNKVWKCFNTEAYAPFIAGTSAKGFTLTESGGSNLASITIDNADINFLTDLDSSFENDVFITSGNEFVISTGKAKSKLPMVVKDNAGNQIKGNIPTDAEGNIKFTIEDLDADLTDGSYTFMLNGKEVKLYAREPAIVRDATMPSVIISGEQVTATVVTSANATKVQLVENGYTRTYYKTGNNVVITENENGTLTWTLSPSSLTLGTHTFDVRARDDKGVWHDSEFTVSTRVISRPNTDPKAIVSLGAASAYAGEKVVLKIETLAGTQGIRISDDNGFSNTIYRNEEFISATDDGNEIWTINGGTSNTAGQYNVTVYGQYNGTWQKTETVSNTVTVTYKPATGAAIYKVDILTKEIKAGQKAVFEVITNAKTQKVQFIYSGTTATYTPSMVQVVDNGDGTLTWTIEKNISTYGENDIMLKAKSSSGWTEAVSYGTVTVVK